MVALVIVIAIAILTIVIVITIATTAIKTKTPMKEIVIRVGDTIRIKSWGVVLVLLIIILWLGFGFVPFFVPNISDSTVKLLNTSFTAATALFTGIAFVVAFCSLSKQQENIKEQQENLSKQIELNVLSVFMDTMKYVTNSQSFKQCQNYILSEDFFHDRETIREQLKKSMGEDITLDDYSKVLDQKDSMVSITENEIVQLRQNRDKIKNFCMRMEYIGIVVLNSKDKTAERMLLDLYGHVIKKTYENRLSTLIKNDQIDDSYTYYVQLYNLVKESEQNIKG